MRVFLDTMGCRTNAADSSLLVSSLQGLGVILTSSPNDADWILINSCTVTHKADRDTGKHLRRFRALPSAPSLLVLGCLPNATPDNPVLLLADAVVPGWDLDGIASVLFGSRTPEPEATECLLPHMEQTRFSLERTLGQSRVNIKICQGCDGHCTYCIVPSARGKPISSPPFLVEQEIRLAGDWGFQEVVISGTHLLRYGKDLMPPCDLLVLMDTLEIAAPNIRFRFGSVEPDHLLTSLIDKMATSPRWCRHIHVALQHCADQILDGMRRKYRFAAVASVLHQAVKTIPGLTIGLDFIVGFPGETDQIFEEAFQRLADLPFTYLHVFSYSPRPGTPAAARIAEFPRPDDVKKRSLRLRMLSNHRYRAALKELRGTTIQVLVERQDPDSEGFVRGHSDNYFNIAIVAPNSVIGSIILCKGIAVSGDLLMAEKVETAC